MDGERDSLPAAREREGEIQDGAGYEGEGAELRIEDRMISRIAIFDPRSSILDPRSWRFASNFQLQLLFDKLLADNRALFRRPSSDRSVKLDDDPALVAEIFQYLQHTGDIDHALPQFDEVVFRPQRPAVEPWRGLLNQHVLEMRIEQAGDVIAREFHGVAARGLHMSDVRRRPHIFRIGRVHNPVKFQLPLAHAVHAVLIAELDAVFAERSLADLGQTPAKLLVILVIVHSLFGARVIGGFQIKSSELFHPFRHSDAVGDLLLFGAGIDRDAAKPELRNFINRLLSLIAPRHGVIADLEFVIGGEDG